MTADRVELARLALASLTRKERAAVLLAFAPAAPAPAPAVPRLLSRREAAGRFGRSEKFVDRLAAAGTLPRVTLPGRTRASGFREADVARLIQGEVA